MVCEKCELKLKHVATPDPFKMQGKLEVKRFGMFKKSKCIIEYQC